MHSKYAVYVQYVQCYEAYISLFQFMTGYVSFYLNIFTF